MMDNDLLLVGKIVGVHGINGNIKVYSYAESSSVFKPGSRIFVRNPGGCEKSCVIRQAKSHKKGVLLSLEGIEDRDDTRMLVGGEIYINKTALPELENGLYYWFDIIGLDVFTTDGKYIGCVESIITTGSNDVYVVQDPDKGKESEILIPALKTVVEKIDLSEKTIRVELPDGLNTKA